MSWRLPAAVLLVVVGNPTNAASRAATDDSCPDVSGQYRVAGFGSALSDVLDLLHAGQAGFLDSGVELSGPKNGELGIGLKSGRSGVWSVRPVHVLRKGADFGCGGGSIAFTMPVADTHRKTDDGTYYTGEARIVMAPASQGTLSIGVTFTGRQRISLYSYDSANLSIPKLGTRTTLSDTILWPSWSEPQPAVSAPAEPQALLDTRRRLSAQVLGNISLGGLQVRNGGTLATFKASRSDDVIRFEDRLRSAAIHYQVKVEPIWSNNSYHMEFLIRSDGPDRDRPSRPSAFRVEHALQRALPPRVDVDKVVLDEDGYRATLNLSGDDLIETVIARLEANSSLFADITLIDETSRGGAPDRRVARLKLRLR